MDEPFVIGRVENPGELNLEPPSLTLVGYTLEREEVAETFLFRPRIPTGAQLEIIRHTGPDGNVPLGPVVDFVEECVLAPDVERFKAFLHRPEVMIEQDSIISMYRWLTEYYAARPTNRRSGSASGGPPARPTSRANARSAASRSRRSLST